MWLSAYFDSSSSFSETEQPHTSSVIFLFNSSSGIKLHHQASHSPFVIAKRIRVTKEILFPHCSFCFVEADCFPIRPSDEFLSFFRNDD